MKNKRISVFTILVIALIFGYYFQFNNNPNFRNIDDKQSNVMNNNVDENILEPKLSNIRNIKYEWSSTWSNGVDTQCSSIDFDSEKNIYLAGTIISDSIYLGLVKFDKFGNYQWDRTSFYDLTGAIDVVVDNADDIYMIGTKFFDFYIEKYNSSGDREWYKLWGGPNDEYVDAIATDSQNNIYVTGTTYSYDDTVNGDICLTKFDKDGNFQWYKTFGSIDVDKSDSVRVDSNDFIYVSGIYTEPIFDIPYITTLKYDINGNLKWSRTSPSLGLTYSGINSAIDSSNNIITVGIRNNATRVEHDIVILKYNSNGDLLLEKNYWKEDAMDYQDVCLDSDSNLYMVGNTNRDFNILKFNTDGEFLFKKVWDGGTNEDAWGIGDLDDNIYAVGQSNSYKEMCVVKFNMEPKIDINSPESDKFFGSVQFEYNITVSDSDLNSTWYRIWNGTDWSQNFTISDSIKYRTGLIDKNTWGNCSDGPNTIEFYANDTVSTISNYVEINKDTIIPTLDINYPIENQEVIDEPPYFIVEINDKNLDSSWYKIDDGINHYFSDNGTIDKSNWQSQWRSKMHGDNITITFYAKDKADNLRIDEINVTKYDPSPNPNIPPILGGGGSGDDENNNDKESISGFNYIIISIIIISFSIIVIKKRHSKI